MKPTAPNLSFLKKYEWLIILLRYVIYLRIILERIGGIISSYKDHTITRRSI